MNRKQVMIAAAVISTLLLLYIVGFGPVIFVFVWAENRGPIPDWINLPLDILFFPHLWVMYEQQWYFHYIAWFVEHAGEPTGFTWQDFREHHADKFGGQGP